MLCTVRKVKGLIIYGVIFPYYYYYYSAILIFFAVINVFHGKVINMERLFGDGLYVKQLNKFRKTILIFIFVYFLIILKLVSGYVATIKTHTTCF